MFIEYILILMRNQVLNKAKWNIIITLGNKIKRDSIISVNENGIV